MSLPGFRRLYSLLLGLLLSFTFPPIWPPVCEHCFSLSYSLTICSQLLDDFKNNVNHNKSYF